MDLAESRQKAWVGDAVLSLYARQWILRERGKMDGELHTRFTSNGFLATMGNPTGLEATIGVIYESEGLEAAFAWIEREILPAFLAQVRKGSGRR
jgi:dsRNA-specific ribonuclease